MRRIARCAYRVIRSGAVFSVAAGGMEASAQAARQYVAVPGELVPAQPYQRYVTTDSLGRRIVFYLSEEPPDAAALPLVVYIHGSGAQSHFAEVDGRIRGQNGHSSFADVARGRARLLIVEKPGVTYLDAPADAGGASSASPEFRSEHTLERWAEAVRAAIRAASALPIIRPGAILVVGHSEGGIVAAKLAAEHDRVTHVAVLAGGGPTQLHSLLALARDGTFFRRISDDPEQRVAYVLQQWASIQADPDNAGKLFFGHPYRRWSSFLATSVVEQLLRTRARIYAAQGTEDRAVAWESFEVLHAELLARGKNATIDAVPGADHSFASTSAGDGWGETLQRVLAWFLASS